MALNKGQNTTLRVARECYQHSTWTTEKENGTIWHGAGMLLLILLQKRYGFDYEFVHEMPPSDNESMHYILKGKF